MFERFLAENISFEIRKIIMIVVYLKLIVWNGWISGIYGNGQGVRQECPKQALRAGVLKTRNAQIPKTGFVTETLTKRIFAPKTPH
jgi:hypothetical protein